MKLCNPQVSRPAAPMFLDNHLGWECAPVWQKEGEVRGEPREHGAPVFGLGMVAGAAPTQESFQVCSKPDLNFWELFGIAGVCAGFVF